MGTMTFNNDLLTTNGYEEFNLFLITGGISENLSCAMDSDIESFADHWATEMDKDLPGDWFDEVTWDWAGMYKEFAQGLPEMLAQAYPDLFTTDEKDTAPVVVGKVTEAHTNDPGGWGCEYITATVKINGKALKELADEYGVTTVHDGRGISGFLRTADDAYWAQTHVIKAIMQELDESYTNNLEWTLDEWAHSDSWISNHIDYGKWNDEL